ncbi:hypothetical protein CORC01_06898 [Colletotrichum orchidophilum]|uniref:Uncharacterized protein n=1 Tax=Colletotrichum orchidophilum TaxID=1209926 RepID=A0A1G4B934_9PEZI|nr:uncharacterized protein CORC01_06898 [Colletotrichum orchidophilum]OHE97863.1 hypothetical protein CORC01_06898 [Colletotrichum orchidophilum]
MNSPILQRGLEEEKLAGLGIVGINNMQAKISTQEAQAEDGVR